MVQWLGLGAFIAVGPGSIPGQGTKSLVDGVIRLGMTPWAQPWGRGSLVRVSLEGGDSQPQAVSLYYLYCNLGCEHGGRQSSLHKEKPAVRHTCQENTSPQVNDIEKMYSLH